MNDEGWQFVARVQGADALKQAMAYWREENDPRGSLPDDAFRVYLQCTRDGDPTSQYEVWVQAPAS